MKDQPIIHVGLGKTGSSFLNRYVFPNLCDLIGYIYYKKDKTIYKKVEEYIYNLKLGFDTNKINFEQSKILISNENLSSWNDPYFWEDFADQNLRVFGPNVNILLCIRKPSEFLTSTYIQRCLHEGNIINEEYFFLNKSIYSLKLNTPKFAIDEFDYSKLIDLYKKRFARVHVVKYENIKDLSFLRQIYNLNEVQINSFDLNKSKIENKSYSHYSVKFTKILSNILNLISLDLTNGQKNTSKRWIKRRRQLLLDNKNKYLDNKLSNEKGKSVYPGGIWRKIIQDYLDFYFFKKKYKIQFSKINIDIEKLDEKYDQLNI